MIPIQEVSPKLTIPELVPENDREDDDDNYNNNAETVIDMTQEDVDEIDDINELTEGDAPMQTKSMLQNCLPESGKIKHNNTHLKQFLNRNKNKWYRPNLHLVQRVPSIHSKLGKCYSSYSGQNT